MTTKSTTRLAVFIAILLFAVGATWYLRSKESEPVEVALTPNAVAVAKDGNEFAFDLYQQLRGQPGNLFISPSSISTALAMTYAGAGGVTRDEMAKTLHFNLPEPQFHAGTQNLLEYFNAKGQGSGVRLQIANHLWANREPRFCRAFSTSSTNTTEPSFPASILPATPTARPAKSTPGRRRRPKIESPT